LRCEEDCAYASSPQTNRCENGGGEANRRGEKSRETKGRHAKNLEDGPQRASGMSPISVGRNYPGEGRTVGALKGRREIGSSPTETVKKRVTGVLSLWARPAKPKAQRGTELLSERGYLVSTPERKKELPCCVLQWRSTLKKGKTSPINI